MKISVVLCVKNESERIDDCITSIISNNPDEIILIDGDSTDNTVEIASKYSNIKIIKTKNSNLTKDRQIGIDNARNDYIAMIDADHRLSENDLDMLLQDMIDQNFDIIQSGLISHVNLGFWDSAEEATSNLLFNIPGPKKMIGTAPAIYKKNIFKHIRFEDNITSTIDDTDFIYRLSLLNQFTYGKSKINIRQYHFANFKIYFRKFLWYGKGDGEFCLKHPNRAYSMIFHLLIRYPIIYSFRSLINLKFKPIPYLIFQGYTRFIGLLIFFLKKYVI